MILLPGFGGIRYRPDDRCRPKHVQRIPWFREAKFGLFIHWGLYAIPAGEWNGKPMPGIGEWMMNRARIRVKEYEQLAGRSNPVCSTQRNGSSWLRMLR